MTLKYCSGIVVSTPSSQLQGPVFTSDATEKLSRLQHFMIFDIPPCCHLPSFCLLMQYVQPLNMKASRTSNKIECHKLIVK
jgi:hypothetical protein